MWSEATGPPIPSHHASLGSRVMMSEAGASEARRSGGAQRLRAWRVDKDAAPAVGLVRRADPPSPPPPSPLSRGRVSTDSDVGW